MRQRNLVLWLAAAVAAGMLGMALPGSARRPDGAPDTLIGYVDLAQVTDKQQETEGWQAQVRAFEESRAQVRMLPEYVGRLRLLPRKEFAEGMKLFGKATLTPREQQRRTELERRSDELNAEYQRLATIETPSEAESRRVRYFKSVLEENARGLQRRGKAMDKKMPRWNESETLDKQQLRILKAVAKIAKREGLAVVVDRSAVHFGGRDLTREVLRELGW